MQVPARLPFPRPGGRAPSAPAFTSGVFPVGQRALAQALLAPAPEGGRGGGGEDSTSREAWLRR